ncbi:toxin-antitoxin system YwqK family antitoxin [Amycolatopsis halotolerans]|uniref:Toxin-antitoxin system YwqK family antitoxin n=1 Tax=Amycolatopsis halotolerans TaxID=330083 RepID=A0ABV7QN48_9PSEU
MLVRVAVVDKQYNGFRQIWSLRPDGVFHGEYTVYWGEGPQACMHGSYTDGKQDGVWTHWTRQGVVKSQVRYRDDVPVEVREAPPWMTEPPVIPAP